MDDLIHFESCRPERSTSSGKFFWSSNSPLQWQEWDVGLREHLDQRFCRYIVDGIREGFRIGLDVSVGPQGGI